MRVRVCSAKKTKETNTTTSVLLGGKVVPQQQQQITVMNALPLYCRSRSCAPHRHIWCFMVSPKFRCRLWVSLELVASRMLKA